MLGLAAAPSICADGVADFDARIAAGNKAWSNSYSAARLVRAPAPAERTAAVAAIAAYRDRGMPFAAGNLGLLYVMDRYGIAPDAEAAVHNLELATSLDDVLR